MTLLANCELNAYALHTASNEASHELAGHLEGMGVRGYFDRLLSFVEYSIDEGFLRREYGSMILVSSAPGELLDMMAAYQPLSLPKWIDRAAT